jgi:mono/diheme cytochrome c family protein
MSEQTNQSPELSLDKRPVSARDMVIMVGIVVLACIGTAFLSLYVLQNQSRAAPVTQTTSQSVIAPSQSAAQVSAGSGDGQALFQQYCIACHSIGAGIVVGPDLEGVTSRRDSAWLARWIAEPDKMLAEGDPIATGLFQEFNNIPMTNFGLSTANVEALVAYLDNPGGVVASSQTIVALPPGNPDRGEAIFTGATNLQNGAPACISCHTTAGVGPLGGDRGA